MHFHLQQGLLEAIMETEAGNACQDLLKVPRRFGSADPLPFPPRGRVIMSQDGPHCSQLDSQGVMRPLTQPNTSPDTSLASRFFMPVFKTANTPEHKNALNHTDPVSTSLPRGQR